MARLIVKTRDGAVKEHELRAVVSIGRQSTNEIQLAEEMASRQHARIIPSGRSYIIEDLQSANGTFVNGQKIQRRVLADGDLIRIGGCELAFRDDAAKDLVGELVSDRYRVLAKLGSGGMGTVYKALQISMDRQVALKVLNPELTRDREFVLGFLNEARTAGQLNHPNIIQVHDFGEYQGFYYFSMELVDGENCLAVLNRDGKFPPERALRVVSQLADALAHAHAHNIVHQDIKPQNLMLDRRIKDQLKLADLGLAKVIGSDRGARRGLLMGTPHYMAPEQAKSQAIDGRTDLYAVGATLFHMLTGRVPYDGKNSIEILTKHVKNPVPDPRQYDVSIPESVAKLVMRLMAKDPAARPASAKEFGEELKAILERERAGFERAATAQRPAAAAAPAIPRPQLRRMVVGRRQAESSALPWVLACFFLLGLVGVLLWIFRFREPAPEGVPPRPGETGPAGALTNSQALALLRQAEGQILQGRLDDAEDTCRRLLAGAPGSAAADSAVAKLSEIAGLRQESAARTELDAILLNFRRNPEALADTGGKLEAFLARRGAARCAADARAELERVRKLLAAQVPPADREKAAREAYAAELARAREFERRGDFRTAERVMLDFAAMHGGTRAAEEAKRVAAEFQTLTEKFLGELWDRAQKAGKERKFRQAAEFYAQIISRDSNGDWGRKAREALVAQDTATETLYKEALAKVMAQFNAFTFGPAYRQAAISAGELVGTRWQSELERLSADSQIIAKLHAAMVKRIEGSGREVVAPFKVTGPAGREVIGNVVGAAAEGLNVKYGPGVILKPWKDLTSQELARVYQIYGVPDDQRLAAGCLLARKGLKAEAAAEFRKAQAVPATAEAAAARLAELEGRANLRAYDFSSGLQVADWSVGSGNWGLEDGELCGGGPGASLIELSKLKYPARGLRLSLEFTLRSDDGVLSVDLYGSDQNYLGVTVDPRQGTELAAAVNGAPTRSTEAVKPTPGTRHLLKLAVSAGQLEVTVDGRKLPALKVGQIESLSGTLRFKLLDGRASLDNVQVRNETE